MARRKNTRRFDPRYFMDEKTETINEAWEPKPYNKGTRDKEDVYIKRGSRRAEPETDEERKHRREKEERRRREREDLGYPPEKSKYFEEGSGWAGDGRNRTPEEEEAHQAKVRADRAAEPKTDTQQALEWLKSNPEAEEQAADYARMNGENHESYQQLYAEKALELYNGLAT